MTQAKEKFQEILASGHDFEAMLAVSRAAIDAIQEDNPSINKTFLEGIIQAECARRSSQADEEQKVKTALITIVDYVKGILIDAIKLTIEDYGKFEIPEYGSEPDDPVFSERAMKIYEIEAYEYRKDPDYEDAQLGFTINGKMAEILNRHNCSLDGVVVCMIGEAKIPFLQIGRPNYIDDYIDNIELRPKDKFLSQNLKSLNTALENIHKPYLTLNKIKYSDYEPE